MFPVIIVISSIIIAHPEPFHRLRFIWSYGVFVVLFYFVFTVNDLVIFKGECASLCAQNSTSWDFPGSSAFGILPSKAAGVGSMPAWGAEIPHAQQPKNQNIKQKQYCNKFNKDFKNSPRQKNHKKKNHSIASDIPPGVRGSKEAPYSFFSCMGFSQHQACY